MEAQSREAAVHEAIDRWEAETGWKADFAVVEGYRIAMDAQYVEIVAENQRLKGALLAAGVPPELVKAIAAGDPGASE